MARDRVVDRWINWGFFLALCLLVGPDFFFLADIASRALLVTALLGTAVDALLFGLVFYLLKIEIRRRRQINVDLAAANRAKTEFLRLAAHDLRNPLNAISLLTSLLPAAAGETAAAIRSNAREMLELIEAVLDAAALESGNIKLQQVNADLVKVARDVIERNQPQANRKGIAISLVAPDHCVAQCDPARIRQAVDNLLSNALKFSPPGKHVSVRVCSPESMVRIEVRDYGPGLTSADKLLLFERYQRLSARPTAGEPSCGLALANARQLVELHGGRIGAHSEGPGHGSVFWFELPARCEPAVE